MIIEFLINPFILIIRGLINLFPQFEQTPDWATNFFNMLNTACLFIPVDVWIAVLSNVFFWITIHLVIGIVRFIYDVLPFV